MTQKAVLALSLIFEPVNRVADNDDTAGDNKGPRRDNQANCQETIRGIFSTALAGSNVIDFLEAQFPFRRGDQAAAFLGVGGNFFGKESAS